MDVTPLIPAGRKIIQSYSANGFKVNGTLYPSAIIVMPEQIMVWDFSGAFADLSEESFSSLFPFSETIDVFLLGAGAQGAFMPPALRQSLKDRGLKADVMDSGAACRTYNVLMAEGRRVAAALLPTNDQPKI